NDSAAVVAATASGHTASPACTRSRMLLSRDGAIRVHACPLADDDTRFDLGNSLDQAMASRVVPDHPRCHLCLTGAGVDYAGIPDRSLERDLHAHKEAATESIVR